MADEATIAGAGYILNFFMDIENLTNSYAAYINVITRLTPAVAKDITDDKKEIRLTADHQKALDSTTETFRTWATRVHVKINALQSKIKTFNVKEIDALYKELIKMPVFDREKADEFVIKVNEGFVKGPLEGLLQKSRDIYSQVIE